MPPTSPPLELWISGLVTATIGAEFDRLADEADAEGESPTRAELFAQAFDNVAYWFPPELQQALAADRAHWISRLTPADPDPSDELARRRARRPV